MLTDSDETWIAAMQAALDYTGPGQYKYGWELNLEPRRDHLLSMLPGVQVGSVRPLTVEAVDFARWSTWGEYHRSISNNSRRNAKKAAAHYPDLDLRVVQGFHTLVQIPKIIGLRQEMYQRKGIRFGPAGAAISTIGHVLSSPKYVFTAVAQSQDRALAGFTGVKFGAKTYYLDGGSQVDNHGASWYLLIEMLRQAYERHSDGKFIMGYIDHATHDEAVGGGLLRSRQSCRVTDYETSEIVFQVN